MGKFAEGLQGSTWVRLRAPIFLSIPGSNMKFPKPTGNPSLHLGPNVASTKRKEAQARCLQPVSFVYRIGLGRVGAGSDIPSRRGDKTSSRPKASPTGLIGRPARPLPMGER